MRYTIVAARYRVDTYTDGAMIGARFDHRYPEGKDRVLAASGITSGLPLVLLVVALVVTTRAGRPLWTALAAAYTGATAVALAAGWSPRVLAKLSIEGARKVSRVILLLAMINVAISVWLGCGSVQSLVYYGLRAVSPGHLPVAAFLTATVVSLLLGTAIGTLSTVGLAAMAMARASGIRAEVVAGALLSGALLGDRFSPVSPIFHASCEVTGSSAERLWKKAAAVEGPAWFVALGLYIVMQAQSRSAAPTAYDDCRVLVEAMASVWPPSLLACTPPIMVLGLTALRVPVFYSLLSGIATGVWLSLAKGTGWSKVFSWASGGFSAHTWVPGLDKALSGGGLSRAAGVTLLLAFAGAFSGVMGGTGMFAGITAHLTEKTRGKGQALLGIMGLSIASACVMSNQIMSVLVPSEMTREIRRQLQIEPEAAAMTTLGSGGVISPLVPWNVMGMMVSEALSLPTWSFAPFALYVFAAMAGVAWDAVIGSRPSAGTRGFPPAR